MGQGPWHHPHLYQMPGFLPHFTLWGVEKVNLGYSIKSTNSNAKKLFVAAHGKNRNGDKKNEVESNVIQQQ